jgi:hypothetical protein
MPSRSYRLLDAFERMFHGVVYRHRHSAQCDIIALQLYEDLYQLGKSSLFKRRVSTAEWVVNTRNTRRGVVARRGDGTFGDKVPRTEATVVDGFVVPRGETATVEIGIEMKILAKAMIKQIDRVIGDLEKQVRQFEKGGGQPISVGVVGINHADHYTSHEGSRKFTTDGGASYRHPIQEAAVAERRLLADCKPSFDHFIVLSFRATNEPPYPFEWVDPVGVARDYGAMLTRISREYDSRFRNGNGHGSTRS